MTFEQDVQTMTALSDEALLLGMRDALVCLSAVERDAFTGALFGEVGILGGEPGTSAHLEARAPFVLDLARQIQQRELVHEVEALIHPYYALPLGWELESRTVRGRERWTWAETCQIAWNVNKGAELGSPRIPYDELGGLVLRVIEDAAPGIEPNQTTSAEQMAQSILLLMYTRGVLSPRCLGHNVSFMTPCMTMKHIAHPCHSVAMEGYGAAEFFVSQSEFTETYWGFDYLICSR